MTLNRRKFVSLTLPLVALGTARTAWAKEQSYPNRQIRLISPYTPGGGNDVLSRTIANGLGPALGQAVIVINKPGANTIIGNEFVARSNPDGYTLIINSNGFVINPSFYRQLPFDTAKDIVPVGFIGSSTLALVCNVDLPAMTVSELIALAKSKPGQLNFATTGYGGPGDLAGAQFNEMAGVNIRSVPYKGAAQAITDLMGGQVQLMFMSQAAVPHGKVRLLGVTTKERSPQFPDVPTIAEAGIPGYEASLWYGIMTTAGTPRPVIQRLNDEVRKLLQQKKVGLQLASMGITPGGSAYATPEKFSAFINAELLKTASIAKSVGIQPK